MRKIRTIIAILAVTIGIGVLSPAGVHAKSVIAEQCKGVTDSSICKDQNASGGTLVKDIINILLFIVGALSVIMIIVAGILYVTSAGDSGGVTRAKNTLLYAIVGLIVAFLGYAIVNFVLKLFIK